MPSLSERVMIMNRVQCLYRVSTDGQVNYDSKNSADIPMQRLACRKFAEQKGWNILFEDQEEGVSGHKIRAANRDKIQLIKDRARNGEFDILLVFLFDRLGRIADETPFVVEWFARHNIQVWSTQEGEQKFESHVDKLTNYIRFWQADGESEKTSIRTSTRMGQMVEEGCFTGGSCPYGYKLVKKGRTNRKGQDVCDLEIDPEQASVVQTMFDRYVNHSMGAHSIALWLKNRGFKTISGKNWNEATIRNMLCNITYTGILRSGESRSPVQEHLVIIDQLTFDLAQKIRISRKKGDTAPPRNVKNETLVNGLTYCGHCGARLNVTTNRKYHRYKSGEIDDAVRLRYTCYGKSRHQTNCDGQTGYTSYRVDSIVERAVQELLSRMASISQKSMIENAVEKKAGELHAILQSTKRELTAVQTELQGLKNEVFKSIQGNSCFPPDLLNELIIQCQKRCDEATLAYKEASENYAEQELWSRQIAQENDEFIRWATLWQNAEFSQKKTITAMLVKKVVVSRDYKIHIQFNVAIEQFLGVAIRAEGA